MRFLENSFRFLVKNIIFVLPLFIANLFYSYIFFFNVDIIKLEELLKNINSGNLYMVNNLNNNYRNLQEAMMVFIPELGVFKNLLIISFILFLLIIPATYGIINRIYSDGKASFLAFFIEMKNNCLRFLLYCLAVIIFWLFVGFIAFITLLVLGLIAGTSTAAYILVSLLMFFGYIMLIFFLMNVSIMGFAVVVTDKKGPFEGISEAMTIIRTYIWAMTGITLLLAIDMSVANFVIMFTPIKEIKEVYFILSSILSTIFSFILIVFNFEVYRYETDKNIKTIDQIPDASEI